MGVLGLIPARGGSKRLENKNLADLGGRPLIAWTIAAALQSRVFDDIVVSTDSEEILAIAQQWGAQAYLRSIELSCDAAPMRPVLRDAVERYPCDVSILLQPTSPLRAPEDIAAAYDLLRQTSGDSVVSVTAAPEELVFEVAHAQRLRPRNQTVVPNGALYLLTDEALKRGESWYSGLAYAYVMPRERSLDIDTPLDLAAARAMVAHEAAA